jgi:NDP-sugar pyrophosphorylase family protein
MLNILIPLGAQSMFFEQSEHPYPKPLVEIKGRPMIQHVIENLSRIQGPRRFIFILREEDCSRHHLDSTVRLLAGEESLIIRMAHPTKGAACSALLAIDHIGNEQPLLIMNGDQIFDADLNVPLQRFTELGADAGCLTFESVHPRWSYVRLEGDDDIIETAEKHPLSRHAIAGAYWFARGSDFVQSAMQSIAKDASLDGVYYIAPVLNELILQGRSLKALPLPPGSYHTFYSPKKIEDYENGIRA